MIMETFQYGQETRKYFKTLNNANKLKNIDRKSIFRAKKILYFRKKLQRDNPYNLVTARKLISKKEFFNKLKKVYIKHL